MVTVHSARTERKLRRYAEIAGGEAALQHGFETWYQTYGRVPTAEEFTKHLIDLRIDQVRENTRRRVEARLQEIRQQEFTKERMEQVRENTRRRYEARLEQIRREGR